MMTPSAAALRPYAGGAASSELERLRDRVDELETLLGLKQVIRADIFAGPHRRRVETIARLLLTRQIATKEAIALAIGLDHCCDKSTDVYAFHARKALRCPGIELKCEYGIGWYVAAADKPKLRALLGSPS